ncbi:hypothetical protein IC229_15170 [Spirosoma sp. BT702]|uniref:Tetratricopeptide repeat protein n=1 Tax=Spirosoma profusum TaxID=2771354 RepID=A0A926XWB6_9BACT|nr:hypothetical protein [Spirosoma profusum]MBD2701989.1 hypothetical protein [Spirosoma profusum]
MKSFRHFFVRFRKPFLTIAVGLGLACGPSFDPSEFMSFFMPESATMSPGDKRYMFSPQLYADTEWDVASEEDTLVVDENVRAWAAYADGNVPEKVVSKALYAEDAAAVNTLKSKLSAPAVTYLNFAWSTDNGQSSPWDAAATPVDSARLPQQLEEAKTTYQTTSDGFLKERYAFQAVKLASQIGDFKQASQLFDQLVKPLPKKTFISDWALSRRAGASLALGDTSRAIYEFAQVFARCPSRREAAELSLRKYGIHFREDALQYATNDTERAAVYALCAIQPGQDGLDLLKSLVHLAPKNPLVELVMAREINRNEYYFFEPAQEFIDYGLPHHPDSTQFEGRKTESTPYFEKLRTFALESAENKELGNAAYWYTAGAYLDYAVKDYKAAQTHLEQAEKASTSNKVLKTQITVQQMLLLAAQTENVTPEVENKLITYLEEFDSTGNFRLNNAFVSVCKRFADLYQNKADAKTGWLSGCSRPKTELVDGTSQAKSYLMTMLTSQPGSETYFASTADPRYIEDTVRVSTVQAVIAYANQGNQSDFDKRLIALSRLTTHDLNLLLGRRLIMDHRYSEAAEAFAKVDAKVWDDGNFSMYFQTNPFAVKMPKLSDPAENMNFPAEVDENPYSPVTFVRKMAELEQQAKAAKGDKAAELYYQLGCGAWNLSWYGNAWLVAKSYWSGAELSLYDLPTDPTAKQKRFEALAQTDYYTTTYARNYFEKSVKIAKTQALADRSAYMAARCEANAFTMQQSIEQVRNGYVYEEDSTFVKKMKTIRKSKFSRDFTDYLTNHTKSAFHSEMLQECPFYKDFMAEGE